MGLIKNRLQIRRFLVYAVIFVITGGSLFDIITGKEHWPFSPYPMFSKVRREYSLTRLQLFGIARDEPHREILLYKSQYIQQLDSSHLSVALKEKPESMTREGLGEMLLDILSQYEILRHADSHNGPPLQGIRLYRSYWKLDPWARNIDRPYRRELILDIRNSTKR